MQIEKFKSFIQTFIIIFLIYFYFKNSKYLSVFVMEGLYLCYSVVIPSLFIFIVFTNYISNFGFIKILGYPFIPIFKLLKIKNTEIISYCILSILGGFATGGYFLSKIKKEYTPDENTIGILSILASNNSPAFVICAVGINMLGNYYSGLILYCSIMLSSLITAFIFSFIFEFSSPKTLKSTTVTPHNFVNSLNSSVISIIYICGAVVFSYSVCKAISLYTQNLAIYLVFSIFSEVTTACKVIIDLYGKNIYLVCCALTICPLSTCLQLKSYGDIPLKILFISKLIHIPLSLIILRVAVNLFPQTFMVYANGDISVAPYWNAPQISCWLFIISICFVIFFDRKIKVFTNFDK